jgi:hypothetical protein
MFAENRTPECGVRFHARISSSTVGPRKSPRNVPISGDVDRPVTSKARASFQAERFFLLGFDCLSYRSAADLACKWPVRPITVFCKSSYCIIYLLCPRPPGDFFFYFEFVFFFGKRGEARGNGPADRGRRRKLASRTIWDFAFGSPLFFNFVFEFKLLFESFPFFIAARAQPFILYIIT